MRAHYQKNNKKLYANLCNRQFLCSTDSLKKKKKKKKFMFNNKDHLPLVITILNILRVRLIGALEAFVNIPF